MKNLRNLKNFIGFLSFVIIFLNIFSIKFAIVEVVVTSIQDGFPNWIRKRLVYHELLVLIICAVSFWCGIPNIFQVSNCTHPYVDTIDIIISFQGGIYFFQLIDHYAASVSIMFLAFFQIIAIAWFYGANRLSRNVKKMTGRYPSIYFRFCWLIAAPLLLIVK